MALGVSEERLSELYTSSRISAPSQPMATAMIAKALYAHHPRLHREPSVDGELLISLVGERDLPPLRLSPTYLALLEQHKDQRDGSRQSREAMTFLRHKVEQARWFIDAIHQREETLRKTMTAIVEHQRAFFLTGEVWPCVR